MAAARDRLLMKTLQPAAERSAITPGECRGLRTQEVIVSAFVTGLTLYTRSTVLNRHRNSTGGLVRAMILVTFAKTNLYLQISLIFLRKNMTLRHTYIFGTNGRLTES